MGIDDAAGPASLAHLASVESLMGLSLPDALRDVLLRHDGGGPWTSILYWNFYSAQRMAREWHAQQVTAAEAGTDLADRDFVNGAVARIGSRLSQRIPVAEPLSGCAYIDFDPAPPAGWTGQVVEYTNMNRPIFVAKRFAGLIEHVAHLLSSEAIVFTRSREWRCAVSGADLMRPWPVSGDWRPTGETRPGPLVHVPPSASEQAAFDALIDRLLAVLQPGRFDPTLRRLNPPATEGQVRAAEAALGTALPPFVRALYQRFNGVPVAPEVQEVQAASGCGPEALPPLFVDGLMFDDAPLCHDLLSLEDMVATWRAERDAGLPLAPHDNPDLDHTLRHDNQSALWIPLSSQRHPGDKARCYIDFTPGPAGHHGQLIRASHGWGPVWQSHKSVQGYVEHLVHCAEQGWIEPRRGGWFDARRGAPVVNLWMVSGHDWRPPSDPL